MKNPTTTTSYANHTTTFTMEEKTHLLLFSQISYHRCPLPFLLTQGSNTKSPTANLFTSHTTTHSTHARRTNMAKLKSLTLNHPHSVFLLEGHSCWGLNWDLCVRNLACYKVSHLCWFFQINLVLTFLQL